MRSVTRALLLVGSTLVVAVPATAQLLPRASRFSDVPPSAFFSEAAESFSRLGIIKGYDDGRFGGYDYVTRGQVAVMMDRYDELVVKPLRQQVVALSKQLDIPYCSDGQVQSGEQCDDGNLISGDGCSEQCIAETYCAGGYTLGESFPSTDGCNMCTCTEAGIACTKRACAQRKCFSTSECLTDEYCSVDAGDCMYPCPAGASCVRACGGICLPRFSNTPTEPVQLCGNGRCDAGEVGFLDRTGTALYCPQDCSAPATTCGNGVCEDGEADEYQLESQLLKRGTCPTDCEGGLSSCDRLEQHVDAQFASNLACETDADCTVFIRGCSPYQTCGKAVKKSALTQVSEAVQNFVTQCEGSETPQFCAMCMQVTAKCINNTCQTTNSVQ